jgi:hypothetical protein
MAKKKYSNEELINRVWDIEEIKKLAYRRVYYIAGDKRQEELDDLWVTNPKYQRTASFGRNWGYYVGIDKIKKYYVTKHRADLRAQKKESGQGALNVGNIYAHPLSTALVELAQDGKTAKGLFYSIAQETKAKPDGTADARWILEKVGMDFVKERNGWKIWHIVIAMDLNCEAGENYSEQPVYVDWDNDPVKSEFGKPTIEELVHDATFNWWDNYPGLPPYEDEYVTWSDDISYGPEGYTPPRNKGLGAGEGRNYK